MSWTPGMNKTSVSLPSITCVEKQDGMADWMDGYGLLESLIIHDFHQQQERKKIKFLARSHIVSPQATVGCF